MDCNLCPALCASRTQIVYPTPCPTGGLLLLGEAPGADEDAAGVGFVGRAGQTLNTVLLEQGIERRTVGVANIVRCRPHENRKPTRAEVAACLPKLADFLLEVRPRVIVTVGGVPTAAFLGPGALSRRVEESHQSNGVPNPALAHEALRAALQTLAVRVFPMPHTSPLAWNRNAPDGRKWSAIGREQVARAVSAFATPHE